MVVTSVDELDVPDSLLVEIYSVHSKVAIVNKN